MGGTTQLSNESYTTETRHALSECPHGGAIAEVYAHSARRRINQDAHHHLKIPLWNLKVTEQQISRHEHMYPHGNPYIVCPPHLLAGPVVAVPTVSSHVEFTAQRGFHGTGLRAARCMLVVVHLLCTAMKLWADLRAVASPDMSAALFKCEGAANAPVDAILVDWLSVTLHGIPEDLPPCDVISSAPMPLDQPTAPLLGLAGERLGVRAMAAEPAGQSAAMAAVGSASWIHLDATTEAEWTMIPAENLISVCDGTPSQLAVTALSAQQVPGLAFALQLGVDALVLAPPDDEDDVRRVMLWQAAAITRAQRTEIDEMRALARSSALADDLADELAVAEDAPALTTTALSVGVVTAVASGGVGDRVALDFTSLLRVGEGALVGSSAKLLSLVHGETLQGALVPARPFRVNAGPVHSYVLLADETTKYLDEIRAGDQVLITDAQGSQRSLTVGRCKVEPRPLLLISFELDGASGQVFLQQAETVRVMVEGETGLEPRSVTDLRVGDRLRLRRTAMGTHVGRAIHARVEER